MRPLCLLPFVLAGLGIASCGAPPAPGSEADAVTEIPRTSPRNQKETGNCWLYATAGWIESLEYAALAGDATKRAPLHVAPAYWDYWDWYGKITGGQVHGTSVSEVKDELDSGGSWGTAVELVLARGLVRDPDFLGDGASTDAKGTTAALATLATSLTRGALAKAHARADGALVRREIERAFGVRAAVARAIADVFGEDGRATLRDGATASGIIQDAEHVLIVHPQPSGPPIPGTLREAIGDAASKSDPDRRVGPHAWTDVLYHPTDADDQRAFLRRIQRALHAGAPIPFGWYWASNADPTETGAFTSIPKKPASEADSVDHETLLVDYEVDDVPGYGRLAVGTPANDAQKAAALADAARIVFFRAKDSYYAYRTGKAGARIGYSDLYVDYLVGSVRVCPIGVARTSSKCHDQVPLEDVTLPPGF